MLQYVTLTPPGGVDRHPASGDEMAITQWRQQIARLTIMRTVSRENCLAATRRGARWGRPKTRSPAGRG